MIFLHLVMLLIHLSLCQPKIAIVKRLIMAERCHLVMNAPLVYCIFLRSECSVIWKLCQFCQKLILAQSLRQIMKIWCFHWCNARSLCVCFRCLAWPRRSGRTFRPPATGRTLVFTAGPTWLTTTSSSQSLSRAVKAEPTFSTQLSTSDAGQQRKGFYLQVHHRQRAIH